MTDMASFSSAFESRLYCIHALTPLHVGAGRGVGFIDLPIVREQVTGWPYVPASAVKGVLLDHHDVSRDSDRATLGKIAFGSGGAEASNSGSLVFTDAHLVCLAARSLYGTFAWCTSPMALERLRRDLHVARLDDNLPQLAGPSPSTGSMSVQISSDPPSVLSDGHHVYLEDLDFDAVSSSSASQWAIAISGWAFTDATWRTTFRQRFAVLPDEAFNFLCETATQVDARVKIDDQRKTVADGALWYEESLPAETLLAGIVWCGPVFGNGDRNDSSMRARILEAFAEKSTGLQMGGKATVGRGRVEMTFTHSAPASSSAPVVQDRPR